MANVNTTTTNRNIFTTIGRNTAAIVAAGTLALGLSGCVSGNGRNEDVKPLPTPSQIDKPTTDPTTPATQEPTKGEVNDPSQLECVGQKFTMSNENGVEVVDAQRAYDCIKDAGQVKLKSTAATRTLNEGYVISAYSSQNELLRFSLSDDWRDESEFGILRVRIQD